VYGLLVEFGLCDIVCKLFALKMIWVSITVYSCFMLYLWKKGIVWEVLGPTLPLVFFL
jgi:hypothetical protein